MKNGPALIGFALALMVAAGHGRAVADESGIAGGEEHRTATFSMYCYWTGEATLGRVDGVIASRIGHWGRSEIVQVDYDPARTDVAELVSALRRQNSFYSLIVGEEPARPVNPTDSIDAEDLATRTGKPRFIEPKHSLRTRHPELYALELSEEQAIALNSWSYFGGAMPDVLTVEQKERLSPRR